MGQFDMLLSPAKIRHVEVKNRIAVTAHATGLNPNSYPSDKFIAYNAEKARNGVGLLMTMGSGSVHPTSPNSDWGGIHNWDESILPYLRKMSEAIKPHGAILMAQISHRGRRANRDVTWLPIYAPSDDPEPLHRDMPHEIQSEDVDWLVDAYVQAALRLKRGGFDGAEISAAHGHLIDQFWSPISNHRSDAYGGSLENRMRFGMQVIDAVRDAVGDDFLVGLRMTGDELIENGLTVEDMQQIALKIAETGKIDILNVIGSIGTTEYHQALTVPSMNYPAGIFTGFAASIRATLQENGFDIPVLACGKIVHPLQAETILAEGQADFVGMNRAIIADPEMPQKTMDGRIDDIRLCMGANEGCIGRIYVGKPMICVQNPVISRESELIPWRPTTVQKRVVVVGGGPGGLEAARMAAERGHQVTLLEKSSQLGGQIRLAGKAPNRDAYTQSVDWLEGQIRKLGIDVRLGVNADEEDILALQPEAVIIATGSTARRLHLPGADAPFVFTARDVLEGGEDIGHKVLFIDEHHHQEGLSTAEYLAQREHEVTVISRLWIVGEEIDGTLRPDLYARLDNLGVVIHPNVLAKQVEADGSVLVENYHSHREWTMGPYDAIVVAAKGVANDGLWKKLKGRVPELHLIGDAVAPRGLHDALLEGTRVARVV
ncbi:MAG: FAD-dependent oxidoreductase [Alicyclobacillaceae bacterium]|nr:FAD-dependent oxidoreductase [Alicyclobacillaceae bacterium]